MVYILAVGMLRFVMIFIATATKMESLIDFHTRMKIFSDFYLLTLLFLISSQFSRDTTIIYYICRVKA